MITEMFGSDGSVQSVESVRSVRYQESKWMDMGIVAAICGVILAGAVLWDALEMIILPRTVARRVSLSSFFIEFIWKLFRIVGKTMSSQRPLRERLLGTFGPV